ncbi:MAG TPA: 2-oxo-4-hydroxy-4-carboxy-5-ureidoimidazoline decarboxylase [Pyrinomonadaceae bacterium]|nr:2-oxo-4-hydroxy-4-carboxy-5-ureidoimidazoline decarboxylase [Pyrinomonadaceae bacterium]
MDEALRHLNSLAPEEVQAELLKCCGSTRWAREMAGRRPFADERALLEAADRVWLGLSHEDWLEAFRSHPKIGERKAARETGAEARRWSAEEQRGTSEAAPDVLAELAEANREYERKFGYIFIVCATGKSAAEMLSLLRQRLRNDPETELRVAAEEQRRITRLRLEKLLDRNQESGAGSRNRERTDVSFNS